MTFVQKDIQLTLGLGVQSLIKSLFSPTINGDVNSNHFMVLFTLEETIRGFGIELFSHKRGCSFPLGYFLSSSCS